MPWAVCQARSLAKSGTTTAEELRIVVHSGEPEAERNLLDRGICETGVGEEEAQAIPVGEREDSGRTAAGAIAMVLDRLGEEERERIHGELAEQLRPFGGSGKVELPATSLVVSAS